MPRLRREPAIAAVLSSINAPAELPKSHPFDLRYTRVAKIDWEACRHVLDEAEKQRVLGMGW